MGVSKHSGSLFGGVPVARTIDFGTWKATPIESSGARSTRKQVFVVVAPLGWL